MLHGVWLVIELGRDVLPTNIYTEFDDYTMKTIEVIERTNALDAARRTCSHNTSLFSNGQIKRVPDVKHAKFCFYMLTMSLNLDTVLLT